MKFLDEDRISFASEALQKPQVEERHNQLSSDHLCVNEDN